MSVGGWTEVMNVLKASEKLLQDTLLCDGKSVAEGLDRAHTEVSSILTYNMEQSTFQSASRSALRRQHPLQGVTCDENSLGCAIGLAYYSARKDYKLIREFPTGKGFADVVFLPLPSAKKPALVVELKYDKTAVAAIQQIKDRNYTQALSDYTGEILLVGINYDKDCADKPHSCVIEKVKKE